MHQLKSAALLVFEHLCLTLPQSQRQQLLIAALNEEAAVSGC